MSRSYTNLELDDLMGRKERKETCSECHHYTSFHVYSGFCDSFICDVRDCRCRTTPFSAGLECQQKVMP